MTCEKICKNCIWMKQLKPNFKGCELVPDMIIEVKPTDTCGKFFHKLDENDLIRSYRYGEI